MNILSVVSVFPEYDSLIIKRKKQILKMLQLLQLRVVAQKVYSNPDYPNPRIRFQEIDSSGQLASDALVCTPILQYEKLCLGIVRDWQAHKDLDVRILEIDTDTDGLYLSTLATPNCSLTQMHAIDSCWIDWITEQIKTSEDANKFWDTITFHRK